MDRQRKREGEGKGGRDRIKEGGREGGREEGGMEGGRERKEYFSRARLANVCFCD
jgi:hypothetical protein